MSVGLRLRQAAYTHSWSVVLPAATVVTGAALLIGEHSEEGNERSLCGTPAYLDRAGLQRFQGMACEGTDVFMASYPKCGTTWCHQILFCLLRMDERGEFAAPLDELVGSSGQVYPDGVPAMRADGRPGATAQRASVPSMEPRAIFPIRDEGEDAAEAAVQKFGGWTVQDLVAQQRPRLFSSHIKADNLPGALPASQARLVICTRSPKDALLSGFFFLQKLDNATFPALRHWFRGGLQGHFDRFIAEPGPVVDTVSGRDDARFGCGDYFGFYRDLASYGATLGHERCHTVCYERLTSDFDAEVRRLAAFLGVPLTEAKLDALRSRTAMGAQLGAAPTVATARAGKVAEHKQYLTPAHWAALDRREAASASGERWRHGGAGGGTGGR
jgi:hypothetical protein